VLLRLNFFRRYVPCLKSGGMNADGIVAGSDFRHSAHP
jgi:hypothetical protein